MSSAPLSLSPSAPATPVETTLAANIVRLRTERDMPKAVLALRTGWSLDRIEALECGADADLTLDDIDVLAAAFLVTPARLFA